MTARLRLGFMGTPDFSVPALMALIDAGHEIAAVFSQPPRPSGRGHKERPSPVHEAAAARGIAVRTPGSLKSAEVQADFAALGLDLAVVVAYGLILPKAILAAPRFGCLNIHASLLPRWRGAAPIQRAILAGDPVTGVSIMQMDEGLDTGAVVLSEAMPIAPFDDAGALHDALAALGAKLIVRAVAGVADGDLHPIAQPDEGVTYAAKITREETRIDWSQDAEGVCRQVRAFAPQPGAWFEHSGERIKLLSAQPVDYPGARRTAGTVIDAVPLVACGQGAVQLGRLQRAGKGALPASEFLRGYALPPGAQLG